MKRIILLLSITFLSTGLQANDLPKYEPLSCTSIMVGKKASSNGAVITSHTCDGNYRTWVGIVPAAEYEKGATMEIYRNRLHTESVKGRIGLTVKGTIPQANTTFAFLDTAYPCMNEKRLAMGETTITGRKELVNSDGLFMIEELQRVALQRCSTARGAIKLIGELIEKYGYGDWGECLTIADPDEVWHFEVFGEGPDKIGGVWAAVRIPDDHIGVSANISRISTLDLSDPDNYMASGNVFKVAKKLGLWDGKKPFCFWEAYGGGNYFGEDKSFHIREYFIMNKLAPSLGLSYDSRELPISVKPDKPVSVENVMMLLGETYEGTEFDVIKNLKIDSTVSPVANPWMTKDTRNMLNAIKPGIVENNRLVAVPQCSYSTVIELHSDRPDAIGGITWIAFDNPGQSPRIPVFCGNTELPTCFGYCGQDHKDDESIIWKFREANKLATVRWGATKKDILDSQQYFIEKGKRELPFVCKQYITILEEENAEAATAFLNGYVADFTGAAILRWEELTDAFWKKFARGF